VADAIESFLWTNSTSRASANTDVIDLHAVEANARQAAEAPAVIAQTLNEIAFAVTRNDCPEMLELVEDEGVGVERLVGDQSAGIDGFDEIQRKSDRDLGPG
jgi:hypothetical protein